MAADNWKVYDSFKEYMGDGTIDLDTDNFNMALVSATYTVSTTNHSKWSQVSASEISGGGYAKKTAITVTWTQSGATTIFDCGDQVWTASGGSISARYGVIYDDSVAAVATDALVCYSLLDNTPTNVTATDGNTLTVAIHANGVFRLSGGLS